MTAAFFEPGKTYRHYDEAGEASTEGLFHCVYAGRAPAAFEHYSEELGVAFGWRQGIGPSGEWEALGAYDTPDFAGWREVRDVQRPNLPPDGCRWCGEPNPHGLMYRAGVGLHGWVQPTDRQRLERMQERRAGRQAAPICGERLGEAVCVATDPDHWRHVTADGDYWISQPECPHDDCEQCEDEEPSLHCGATAADGTACGYIAQHRRYIKPHTFEPDDPSV